MNREILEQASNAFAFDAMLAEGAVSDRIKDVYEIDLEELEDLLGRMFMEILQLVMSEPEEFVKSTLARIVNGELLSKPELILITTSRLALMRAFWAGYHYCKITAEVG